MKKLSIIIIIINLIILSRVFYLNIIEKNYYYQIINKENNSYIEGMTAPRGRILDINGVVLVDNIGVKSIIYNKLLISSKEEIEIAAKLSEIIELEVNPSKEILSKFYYLNNAKKVNSLISADILRKYELRKITSKDLYQEKLNLITDEMLESINKKAAYFYYLMNKGYSFQDKILKTNITDEEYLKINTLNLAGIRTDITWERYYPYQNVLRDVFGSVSSYDQGIPYEYKTEFLNEGYNLSDRVGISNLEYIYDQYLRGDKAKYKIEKNHLTLISEAKKGKDIVISIDIKLQEQIESILEEEMLKSKNAINTRLYNSSYIVISNPTDGSILALVGKKIDKKNNLFEDHSYYTALNSFTVGSVVKAATISVGYKYNLINENTKITDSCVRLYSQLPKCSWKSLGVVNDIRALSMSSNYFQFLIAIGLTGHKYQNNIKLNATQNHFNIYRSVLSEYGLGVKTGIDLLNESSGIKGSTISDDLLLNMAIGQYDTYTPLNLSQYINTIATGKRTKLSLLKYVLNDNGSIYYQNKIEVYNNAPISDFYLNRIRSGFKSTNDSGTGYYYVTHKYSSAGKTGTSESFLDIDNDGVIDKKTITASYAMYAPFENPEISIIITSPHIKESNTNSNYRYPLNMYVIKRITELFSFESE